MKANRHSSDGERKWVHRADCTERVRLDTNQAHRRLGNSDLFVSSIGLGCVTFGREIDEAESVQLLDHAVSCNINLLDTAAAYSNRRSEQIIGRWMKSRSNRDRILLATKIKGTMRRRALLDSVDESLRALQSEYIDLFQLHEWPAKEDPLDETLEAMNEAVKRGKVRYLGLSNAASWQLCKALWLQDINDWARFESIQPSYSLVERHIESEVLPLCEDQKVGVISYSPLAAGFLTGKYQPDQPIPKKTRFDVAPGHQAIYFKSENFALVERLRVASQKTTIPMAELALGWVLRSQRITSVLIGARIPDHVDQALRAQSRGIPEDIFTAISCAGT